MHLPTGPSKHAETSDTHVRYDSTRKHSLITSDPIPSLKLKPETGSCRSATTENPNQTYFCLTPDPSQGT